MKKSKLRKAITLFTLVVALSLTVIPCMANAITPYLSENHVGFNYSIPEQNSKWNGKDEDCFWGFSEDQEQECRFNLSILSSQDVSLTSNLNILNEFWFDETIDTIELSGSNSAWTGVHFIPDSDETYYATVTRKTDSVGCNGRVSVTLP